MDFAAPNLIDHLRQAPPEVFRFLWISTGAVTIVSLFIASRHTLCLLTVGVKLRNEFRYLFLPPLAALYLKIFLFFPLCAVLSWLSLLLIRFCLMLQLLVHLYEVGCLLWFWDVMSNFLNGPEAAFQVLHLATALTPDASQRLVEATTRMQEDLLQRSKQQSCSRSRMHCCNHLVADGASALENQRLSAFPTDAFTETRRPQEEGSRRRFPSVDSSSSGALLLGPFLGGASSQRPPVEGPFVKGGPPVEGPPLGEPPVERPPLREPPVERPPLGEPPVERPPLGEPPMEVRATAALAPISRGPRLMHEEDEASWLNYLQTIQLGPYRVLAAFPFFWFPPFREIRSVTKNDMRLSSGLVVQYGVCSILTVLTRTVVTTWIVTAFQALSLVSLVLCMYGLLLLLRATRRIVPRAETQLELKFSVIKVMVFIVKGGDLLLRLIPIQSYPPYYSEETMRSVYMFTALNYLSLPVILAATRAYNKADLIRRYTSAHLCRSGMLVDLLLRLSALTATAAPTSSEIVPLKEQERRSEREQQLNHLCRTLQLESLVGARSAASSAAEAGARHVAVDGDRKRRRHSSKNCSSNDGNAVAAGNKDDNIAVIIRALTPCRHTSTANAGVTTFRV